MGILCADGLQFDPCPGASFGLVGGLFHRQNGAAGTGFALGKTAAIDVAGVQLVFVLGNHHSPLVPGSADCAVRAHAAAFSGAVVGAGGVVV